MTATDKKVIVNALKAVIEKELSVSCGYLQADNILHMYRRNRSTSKLALVEAIRFIIRAECTLEQSNGIHSALKTEGITL